MFKHVLSMILFGGLIGGGLLGGGLIGGSLFLPGCGEDAAPGSPLPSEGEGQGEGEGERSTEGEGEGSQNEGEGEPGGEGEGHTGEGEGPLPQGGDLEPCGGSGKNECRDGLSCMTCGEGNVESVPDERSPGDTKPCEGRICTCPQWFGGTWWAEFPEVRRTDGQEYDFGEGDPNWPFWMNQEVTFEQKGCVIEGPGDRQLLWLKGSRSIGRVDPPPQGFFYEVLWNVGDNQEHPLRSRGTLSQDHNTITGTCEGEYPGRLGTTELFPITCTFNLMRR